MGIVILAFLAAGCAHSPGPIPPGFAEPTLSPRTSTYNDLKQLPAPKGRIVVSVYNFGDKTGQYKSAPASSFSTAVTQGATAMLAQALHDSDWFITLEREGLQNLLTERKIIRAALKKPDTPSNNDIELPSLLAANVLLEGGIVGYDTNILTGGAGARFLGIGASEQYRMDQVTVNLRAIDIRTGRILNNVSTSKTILSQEVQTGVFKFIEYKKLLELEAGVTTNEPTQLCVRTAIEAAVIHMIVDGLHSNTWQLNDQNEMGDPVINKYSLMEPVVMAGYQEHPGKPQDATGSPQIFSGH
jgi:curli production assembly/transport component CsgG